MRYDFQLRRDPQALITVEAPSLRQAMRLALKSAEVACLLLGVPAPLEADLALVLACPEPRPTWRGSNDVRPPPRAVA